jgi:hypothetical protein
LFLCILPPLIGSCAFKKPVGIPLYGAGEAAVLYALSKEGMTGSLSLDGAGELRYGFEKPLVLPPDMSLELDYVLGGTAAGGPAGDSASGLVGGPDGKAADPWELTLEIGGTAWTLPRDARFLGLDLVPGRIRYAVPLPPGPIEGFVITRVSGGSAGGLADGRADRSLDGTAVGGPVFRLRALRLIPRWFGYAWEPAPPGVGGFVGGDEAFFAEAVLSVSPFVFFKGDTPDGGGLLIVDPAPEFRIFGKAELSLPGVSGRGLVRVGDRSFEFVLPRNEGPGEDAGGILIPQGIFPAEPYPVTIEAEFAPAALALEAGTPRVFPAEPVPADPGIVLAYPETAWRDPRYEVFRWPRFPALLIFDTADYQVQERLFKRLAFFTEKRAFRGSLLTDEEMAELHGWNAHDYRAEDLARFFETARQQNFPLNPEERELETILLGADIIRRAGEISPGEGGLIAVSRESPDYLRSLFMIHEGYHGLFFIDPDFREFSRRRWENLDPAARRFITSYFDSQRYDPADSYLMINEFMAYCLQQPVSEAGKYFGQTLAGRINENPWRRSVLPPRDGDADSWSSLARVFTREAEAFSAYVTRRWGLGAGRIRSVTVRTVPE